MWKPIEIKPNDESIVGKKLKTERSQRPGIVLAVGENTIYVRTGNSEVLWFRNNCDDWQIWEEPKRWKAKDGETVFFVDACLDVEYNLNNEMNEDVFHSGNYFRTSEQAKTYAEECKKLAMKLHESWGE